MEILKTPWKFDRRRKIKSEEQVKKIIKMHNDGIGLKKIAKKFNVVEQTIRTYVDDDFKNKSNEAKLKCAMSDYYRNPEKTLTRARKSIEYKKSIMHKIKDHYAKGLAISA